MYDKRYDIFISYRRGDTCDKAEHLKDLLESKFKGRISFDRENMTGPFDVALARRIEGCRDFLLVVGKNSLVFDGKDMVQKQVDLYNYLGSCTQVEFEQKIVELGPDASIDFVRIEIARAIRRKDINIIPVVPETTESFNFSKLNLPDDIVGIKRYEAVFYSDNPDALFKDVVPKILPRLHTKPANPVKKALMLAIPLLLVAGVCVGLWQPRSHQREEHSPSEISTKDIVCIPVNLDLPSGTHWGDRNLGAKSPTDYGDYYEWGKTQSRTMCQERSNGTYESIVHDGARDVVTSKLGNNWSLPTADQIKELIENCHYEWVVDHGIPGCRFTSKRNHKEIFFPAAGCNKDSIVRKKKSYGYYWIGESYKDNPSKAKEFYFLINDTPLIGNGYKNFLYSIRGVFKEE